MSEERLDEFQEFVPQNTFDDITFSRRLSDNGDNDRLQAVSVGALETAEFNEITMSGSEDEDTATAATSAGTAATMSASVNAEFHSVDAPATVEISQFEQLWLAASVPEPVALRQVHQWWQTTSRANSYLSSIGTTLTTNVLRVIERLFVPMFVSTVRFEISVDLSGGTVTEYTDDRELLSVATLDVEQSLLFELLRARGFTTARNSHLPALPDEIVDVHYQSHATVSSASSLWHLRRISDDLESWGRMCAVQRPPPDVDTRLCDVLPISLVANCDEGVLSNQTENAASALPSTLGNNAADRILRRLGASQSTSTHVTVKSASHRVLWLPILVAEVGEPASTALVSGVLGEVVGRHASSSTTTATMTKTSSNGSDNVESSGVIGRLWSAASSVWWQR